MPRRGTTRPYECVRKAWHSNTHQPIRGSLIQEIFRIVTGVHSSSTTKNKEWQDKLPVVVLKAEEIMYCKANSEVEYMDLKTLWDRSNDAINTIIRCDDSTETGDLLRPCIEAALSLGCTLRRTSRSQGHCRPMCYFIPGIFQDPNRFSPCSIVDSSSRTNPHGVPKLSNIVKHTTLSDYNQCIPVENHPMSSFCSVYPLYYGTFLESRNVPNCVPSASGTVTFQTEFKDCMIAPLEKGCDLSLRLGSLSAPSPTSKKKKKKRKADFAHPMDDQAFSWQPKLQCNDLTSRMKITWI